MSSRKIKALVNSITDSGHSDQTNPFYLPYISVTADEKKLKRLERTRSERAIISALRKTGYKKEQIEVIKEGFADRAPEPGETYWYYIGPLDFKTRAFCKLMLELGKVFSQEQIDYISQELGYDVLRYCGSYNCRHQWVRFRGKFINTPPPTLGQIRKLINRGIEA